MYQLTKQFYTLVVALGIVGLVTALPQVQQEGPHTLLDIETPNQFSYNSPLAQPDSLRSKPYFDFLSTLYAHDSAKTDLFRQRPRRDLQTESELKTQLVSADQPKSRRRDRRRRAIVFRPLFVYKQQEIRKQEIAARRRSDQVNRPGANYNQIYNRL
ncbi:uncharacterized protein LOC117785130 [Drosophila innubila]|uniref:uncharacterized protein LOC117785130 n=1 Tax=Drosophila innubila TaxID=198719 RepID=UPI00148E0B70|nr:uncharacterized protein LOC117785130 [Drosophila innubila]